MSFYEAIDAVSLGNHKEAEISYRITGSSDQSPFVDKIGIAGILVWLAPNGTCYQVEYPSEKILGKIAEAYGSEYNPPNGYTFWWLIYGEEEYWIDISDGSIIHYSPPISGDPNPPQNNIFSLHTLLLYVIMPIVLIIAIATSAALIIERKKNKIRKKKITLIIGQ